MKRYGVISVLLGLWLWGFPAFASADCLVRSSASYAIGENIYKDTCDTAGNKPVTMGTTMAGEDVPNDVQKVEQRFAYTNITLAAPTTTVIKSGPGFLHLVTFNKPVSTGTVTCYDNTAASGTLIGTITSPAGGVPVTLTYDVAFSVGLTCVTATAAQDITVSYR